MSAQQWKVAGLLFCSGLCALLYQTVWLRQFRLIFGASTSATAAVLAIFMGGLGLGSMLLGKRADTNARPLAWYGTVEAFIALSALASPLLLWLAAKVYFALGGSVSMGLGLATVVRVVLATVVLAVPTVLMGGTLPAAARAIETDDDTGRRAVALLYGINTLGAVAGALVSTFFLLERLGNRNTLFLAVVLNLVVARVARMLARDVPVQTNTVAEDEAGAIAPRQFVYVSAAVVGFAFLLMELVWYRMLSPILGGTTFMFGLILAVALLGIGLGGTAYALLRRGPATVGGFALTCALEAVAIAVPFALGDRLANLANVLMPLGLTGFGGSIFTWTLITAIVVLPAAFVSGVQFPLLISLLGRGRNDVGREIGAAYAWNTAGAIAGSLAGGFGLMPLLTAPGCWRLVPLLLSVLGLAAVLHAIRQQQRVLAATAVVAAFCSVLAVTAEGPTALWRHAGIGAGRSALPLRRIELKRWIQESRFSLAWEAEGRESSIALLKGDDLSFVVNGKVDGTARGDADTQVMGGLIGAILHPRPRAALVVGLGTGSTAGWLAAVPSMQRVDVVELEPSVAEAAIVFGPVNAGAMSNPRMHLRIGDAREVLLASSARYDIIFSEPSNPYRAGIASLFTREFYEASSQRLNRDGIFLQWVQLYSIDASTLRTIYATLRTVFPYVETYRTSRADAVLVASREPLVYDVDRIRDRVTRQPFRTAMFSVWRAETAESFLGRMIANDEFARAAAAQATELNTDDRPVIEFGFARALFDRGKELPLYETSRRLGTTHPRHVRGAIDWAAVERERAEDRELLPRATFHLADRNDPRAPEAIAQLRQRHPMEADAVLARLLLRQDRLDEATALLQRVFAAYRVNPWPQRQIMQEAINTTTMIADKDPRLARALYEAIAQPFIVLQQDSNRRVAKAFVAKHAFGCAGPTLAALAELEPSTPWHRPILALRAECYTRAELADRAAEAMRDLDEYDAAEAQPIVTPPAPPAAPGSF